MDHNPPDHAAQAFMRRHKRGRIAADDRLWWVRAVVCPRTGAIIADVCDTLAGREDIVLHLPDEGDEAMHLLARVGALEPAHAGAAARWAVYHAEDDRATLSAVVPAMARWQGRVLDGPQILHPHPDPACERSCCAICNQDAARLQRLCERDGVIGEGVRCVGVDPWGVDLLARVRIHRLEFDTPALSAPEMERAVRSLLDGV